MSLKSTLGVTTTPSAEGQVANLPAGTSNSATCSTRSVKLAWTLWQLRLAGAEVGLLTVLLAALLFLNFEYSSILFQTPVGQKLLLLSGALLGGGTALTLVSCLAMDLGLPGWHVRRPGLGTFLAWALGAVQVVLFALPLGFILVVGPAAIQIMQVMTHS